MEAAPSSLNRALAPVEAALFSLSRAPVQVAAPHQALAAPHPTLAVPPSADLLQDRMVSTAAAVVAVAAVASQDNKDQFLMVCN